MFCPVCSTETEERQLAKGTVCDYCSKCRLEFNLRVRNEFGTIRLGCAGFSRKPWQPATGEHTAQS